MVIRGGTSDHHQKEEKDGDRVGSDGLLDNAEALDLGQRQKQWQGLRSATHGCVFHAVRCVPLRCVKTRFQSYGILLHILCLEIVIALNHGISKPFFSACKIKHRRK